MRIFALCLSALSLFSAPAWAVEDRLSVAEFEVFVQGQTVYFDRGGRAFGTEQYLDDKRVIWAFENGMCQAGIWFANKDDQICFVYNTSPQPICWDFLRLADGTIAARAEGDPVTAQLTVRGRDQSPLRCTLPDLGV